MNTELFGGLGRTWLIAVAIMVCGTVLVALDKITGDAFINLVYLCFGAGAVKSTVVGFAQNLPKKEVYEEVCECETKNGDK